MHAQNMPFLTGTQKSRTWMEAVHTVGERPLFFLALVGRFNATVSSGMTPMFPYPALPCSICWWRRLLGSAPAPLSSRGIPAGLEEEDLAAGALRVPGHLHTSVWNVQQTQNSSRSYPPPFAFPFQHKNSIYFYA